MRQVIAVFLASLLVIPSVPRTLAAATGSGTITGVARTTAGQILSGHTVRQRSVRTGELVASTVSSTAGSFSFARLDPGSYVVEVVDPSGRIVGVSSITTVVEGSTASVALTVASTTRVGGAISTPLLTLLIAGDTAGAFGIVAAVNDHEASPSR
jgi:hypothetical protein